VTEYNTIFCNRSIDFPNTGNITKHKFYTRVLYTTISDNEAGCKRIKSTLTRMHQHVSFYIRRMLEALPTNVALVRRFTCKWTREQRRWEIFTGDFRQLFIGGLLSFSKFLFMFKKILSSRSSVTIRVSKFQFSNTKLGIKTDNLIF